LPLVVGVPEMVPVLAASLSPAGSLPVVMRQVYGEVPPVAVRVAVYETPAAPGGNSEVGIVRVEEEPVLAAATVAERTDPKPTQ
jgi:hypothetical protein